MDTALTYKIAMSRLKGMTPRLAMQIAEALGDGSPEIFFDAPAALLRNLTGTGSRIFDPQVRESALEEARREQKYVERHDITPLYFTDSGYPARLAECDDAPLVLYKLGNCDLNACRFVSIVGTRHATAYGLSFVDRLVEQLARKVENVVVVSGLAYGIDIAAHRACLAYGVPTIAVLAHGLSSIYPAVHRRDAARIAGQNGMGALLTEYLHDAPVHRGNFLARNRIVAGMCDCLVVAESAAKGGALVTARLASDYNRDVFALPGRSTDPYSQGCNNLIARNLASLVQDADGLIKAMGWPVRPQPDEQQELFQPLTSDEQRVVDYLTANGDARLNKISIDVGLPMSQLMSLLVDLEFKGRICQRPGALYSLA